MFRFPNGQIDLDQLASGQDCDRVENLNYLHELGCLSKAKLVKTQVVRWKQALKKLDKEEISKNSYHFWREAFIWYWLFKENEGYIQEKIISSIKTSLKMVRKRRKKKDRKRKNPFLTFTLEDNVKLRRRRELIIYIEWIKYPWIKIFSFFFYFLFQKYKCSHLHLKLIKNRKNYSTFCKGIYIFYTTRNIHFILQL